MNAWRVPNKQGDAGEDGDDQGGVGHRAELTEGIELGWNQVLDQPVKVEPAILQPSRQTFSVRRGWQRGIGCSSAVNAECMGFSLLGNRFGIGVVVHHASRFALC